MSQSESIVKLMPALLKARRAFAPALKDSINPAFKSKYVSLDGALDAVSPALLDADIFVAQETEWTGTETVLHTRLIHVSGEWIGSEYPVKPTQSTPQAEGSALTYARRYTLMALCGIAPEDDDGAAASAPRPATQRAQSRPATRKPDSPQPNAQSSVDEFKARLRAADTTEALGGLAAEIGSASMSDSDKQALRDLYGLRMTAVTQK